MSLDTYAKTLTVVIRIVGVFALAGCPVAFLGALIDTDDRIAFIVVGILLAAIGIGCLRGTAITAEQIEKLPRR